MQVYSRSQGKLIDVPDTYGQTPQAEGVTSMAGGQSSVNPDQLKSITTLLMLKNPKQANLLKSVYDLNAPKEPTDTEKKANETKKQTVSDLMQQLQALDRLSQEVNTTGTGIGKTDLFGLRQKLPSFLGGYSQQDAATMSDLSQANTNLFKLAGTQFTEGEKKLLPGLVLDIAKNKDLNQSAISKWREILGSKYKANTGQDYKPSSSSKKSSKDDPLGLF